MSFILPISYTSRALGLFVVAVVLGVVLQNSVTFHIRACRKVGNERERTESHLRSCGEGGVSVGCACGE